MTIVIDRKSITDRMINDIDQIDKRKIDQHTYSKLIGVKDIIRNFQNGKMDFEDVVSQMQDNMTGLSGEIYLQLETDLFIFILTDITSIF